MTFCDVMPIFRSCISMFPEQVHPWSSHVIQIQKFFMSKIGHLQNCLEDTPDEPTPKFANKMHWIQLEYHTKGNKQISKFASVQERITKRNSEKYYVCHETGRLGFFVDISGRLINNPHNIEIQKWCGSISLCRVSKLTQKVVILINLMQYLKDQHQVLGSQRDCENFYFGNLHGMEYISEYHVKFTGVRLHLRSSTQ